jgi:hypothetical protein
MLDVQNTVHQLPSDIAKATSAADKERLNFDLRVAENARAAALSDQALAKWWESEGAPHKTTDTKPIAEATLIGGQTALIWTAAVPATMAVLYLLLIMYFRAQGGYRKEVVLTTAAPASEF